MAQASINITIQSLEDVYKAYNIITSLLKKFDYKTIRVSGTVSDGQFNTENFNDIAALKLMMRNSPKRKFQIYISGSLYNTRLMQYYLNISIFKQLNDTILVFCDSDTPGIQLKFIEAVEQEFTKPKQIPSDKTKTNTNKVINPIKYDVFVSHASADKKDFVNELVVELHGVTDDVWFDRKMIKWGNNIKEKIFEGLEKCEFGIIVFSKSFIGRDWTEKELSELLLKQDNSPKDVILPILLDDLSEEEFKKQYPALKDILFIKQSEHDFKDISLRFAQRLIERLKEQRDNNN